MLEMLLSPRKAERRPWEMFFVGLVYASLSLLLVNWVFGKDAVLSQYSGILIVTFTVLFSLPFMYFTIRYEEKRITENEGVFSLLKEHRKALYAFLWLFFGFVVAFSFWYMVIPSSNNFRAQIETFCMINRPSNFQDCVSEYGIKSSSINAFVTNKERLFMIFSNNLYVLMFALVFSLIFGAGVMFVLAWNASVISAAIGIFSKSDLLLMPLGIARYIIHGAPEICSYFIVALAGGIISSAVIKHEFGSEKFWEVLQDSLGLVIFAVAVLFIAAILEVYVTPLLF